MKTTAEIVKEVIERYVEAKAKWIEKFGTDYGFHAWFTEQVTGKKAAS